MDLSLSENRIPPVQVKSVLPFVEWQSTGFSTVQLGYFKRYTDIPQLQIVFTQGSYHSEWCIASNFQVSLIPSVQNLSQNACLPRRLGKLLLHWTSLGKIVGSCWVPGSMLHLFHAKHHIARIPHEGHHKLLDPGKFPGYQSAEKKPSPTLFLVCPFLPADLGSNWWKARHRMHTSNIIK
jgi:hypothetical protein